LAVNVADGVDRRDYKTRAAQRRAMANQGVCENERVDPV
jgi:hypothetical protein